MKNIVILSVLAATFSSSAVDIATYDERMAAKRGVVTNGVRWIDGVHLPIEGRPFDDTERYFDRLPANVTSNVNEGVRYMKHYTAGMQFRFKTDSRKITFKWKLFDKTIGYGHMPPTGKSGIDIYRQLPDGTWRYVQTGWPDTDFAKESSVSVDWTPNAPCLINLPLYNGIAECRLGINTNATVSALPPRKSGVRKPVVFYGTSITHGGCASRPGMSFVNIVGRKLDVPVVNLGFSGSGRMELEMSEHLANIDASCYVLDCLWNMSDALTRANYERFIRNLRAKTIDVPIVMCERCDVFMKKGERTRYGVQQAIVRNLFDQLTGEGWKKLYYLPAERQYGGDGEGTVDGVHPNDYGMMQMAEAFAASVKEALEL